ncbi:MAG: hypothetical protein Q7T64_15705, partial [Lacisediminimonas sp.]|nr:hypothetical protein [Lacisediminimonas sp.]
MKIKKITPANTGRSATTAPPAVGRQRKAPIRSEHRSDSKKAVLARTGADQLEHARQTDRTLPGARPARKQTTLKNTQNGEIKHHPATRAAPAPTQQRQADPRLQRRRAMLLPKMLAPARPKADTPDAVVPAKQRSASTKPIAAPQDPPVQQRAEAELDFLIAKYQALEPPKPAKKVPAQTATPGQAAQQVEDELEALLADLALQAPTAKQKQQQHPAPARVAVPTKSKPTQD